MKSNHLIVFSVGVMTLISCGATKTYNILSKSNSQTSGTAKFTQKGEKVTLVLNVHNLKPNAENAAHIHENGDCSAPDASSAGGHWNPTEHQHGQWGVTEHHAGDLGNLKSDANGNSMLSITTDTWCVGCTDANKNIIGKSIIIHTGQDDFKTQPTGNAGGRIGCVEIK